MLGVGESTSPGHLRTYLGAAPGVGKTYSMLAEGRQRAKSGEHVVVGWLERHGRSETRAQLGDLEVVAPRQASYRGHVFAELDVSGVLATGADVVLVDELAHSVPDAGRGRWGDAAELLAAGLDVVTTTNVANLRSVRDYAARLTGVGVVESVPDDFVRAGEVLVVPMTVETLRQRIAAGKVFSAERVGGALADYFQPANLEALRELCAAWVDGRLDQVGAELLARRGLTAPPLVVAGISGSQRDEQTIRAAAQLARREGADFLVVYVETTEGPSSRRQRELERHRALIDELGGRFSEIEGTTVARSLADAARSLRASTVVVARKRSLFGKPARFTVGTQLRRIVPEITVEEV